jgi:uncharacterized protein YndB with AHSA1/START domain
MAHRRRSSTRPCGPPLTTDTLDLGSIERIGGGPVKIEASIEIDRPIAEVWRWYAVDHVRNHPRWNPDLELEQISDGPIGLGTKIRRRTTMGESPVDGEMEVTEFDPPRVMGASISDGNTETLGRGTLEERGPKRTLLTISADVPGLDDPETAQFVKTMMGRSLANMKTMMEAEI